MEDVSVKVFNTLGREVYNHGIIEESLHEVMTASWPDGLYQYVIYSGATPVQRGMVNLVH